MHAFDYPRQLRQSPLRSAQPGRAAIQPGQHQPRRGNTRAPGCRCPGKSSASAVAAGAVCGWNMSMEYQQRWSARASVAGFGHGLCDAWAAEYSAGAGPDPGDLVVVDPGNGFSYLFDLAGTLRGESCSRAPRVVGVWGLSQPGSIGPRPQPDARAPPARAVRR